MMKGIQLSVATTRRQTLSNGLRFSSSVDAGSKFKIEQHEPCLGFGRPQPHHVRLVTFKRDMVHARRERNDPPRRAYGHFCSSTRPD